MERIAIFPGSFDPFTVGHESIVKRGLALFDKIIIGIGYNSAKPGYFPIEKRKAWIEKVFDDIPAVEVKIYNNLTVNFCAEAGATYILRGLRTAADFEYERAIAQVNKQISPCIETVFILTSPEMSAVTSTIVREIIRYGGNAKMFLPAKMVID